MINNLRPVSRDKLAQLCGNNQELIRFFESLFSLTTALATDGADEVSILAGAADVKATQALASLQALADAINTAPALQAHPAQDFPLPAPYEHPTSHNPLPVPAPYVQPQGWASYRDTTYTVGSPFTILNGTFVALQNNGANKLEQFLQTDAATLYNPATQKITPRNVGDYYTISVRFKAEATNPNTVIDFGIDLGGSIGVAFGDSRTFPRGSGTEHAFNFTAPCYTLDTFIANGGSVMLGATNGDIDVYAIEYQIVRIFSALQGQA